MGGRVGEGCATRRRVRVVPLRWGVALVVVGGALAGCSGSGPAPLADGSYRLYATAPAVAEVQGEAPTLVIAGDDVEVTDGEGTVRRVLRGPADELVVCPPSGRGAPQRLDGPVTVAGAEFTSPALVGDCGQTRPVRVTLVDLDTVDDTRMFPFRTWVEFCDVADADC